MFIIIAFLSEKLNSDQKGRGILEVENAAKVQ